MFQQTVSMLILNNQPFCRSFDDARLLLEAPDLLGPCETSMQGKVQYASFCIYVHNLKATVCKNSPKSTFGSISQNINFVHSLHKGRSK